MGNSQRNFDSSGPDVKIRGTAAHIFDRYCQLARDANASGDRIAAENYLQHAEHYYRIMMASAPAPTIRGAGPQPNFPAAPFNGEVESDGEAPGAEGEAEPEFLPADSAAV